MYHMNNIRIKKDSPIWHLVTTHECVPGAPDAVSDAGVLMPPIADDGNGNTQTPWS